MAPMFYGRRILVTWLFAFNFINVISAFILGYFGLFGFINAEPSFDDVFQTNQLHLIFTLLQDADVVKLCMKLQSFFLLFTGFMGILLATSLIGIGIICFSSRRRLFGMYLILVCLNAMVAYGILGVVLTGYDKMRANVWMAMEVERQNIAVDMTVKSSGTLPLNRAGQLYLGIQSAFSCCGGYGPRDWATDTEWFIEKYQHILDPVVDDKSKSMFMFPCFGNSLDSPPSLTTSCLEGEITYDCMKAVPQFSQGCNFVVDEGLRSARSLTFTTVIGLAIFQLLGVIGGLIHFCIMTTELAPTDENKISNPKLDNTKNTGRMANRTTDDDLAVANNGNYDTIGLIVPLYKRPDQLLINQSPGQILARAAQLIAENKDSKKRDNTVYARLNDDDYDGIC